MQPHFKSKLCFLQKKKPIKREGVGEKYKVLFYLQQIPVGLVVRIWRFHRRGRGSIPRQGVIAFYESVCGSNNKNYQDLAPHHTKPPYFNVPKIKIYEFLT